MLYSEVDFILHQELRETPVYSSIIEAVALGNTRLSNISAKALLDSAKASVYLKNLIELGIVEREFSINAGIKEKANRNRGIYRLTDNFFRFWYTFGFANLSQLEEGDIEGVYDYLVAPGMNTFVSFAFEDVCRQFVARLQRRGELPFRYAKLGRWTGKTTVRDTGAKGELRVAETEIDLLAVSKSRKKYLVDECKFKHGPFSYSDYLDTAAKLGHLKETATFYYALFSGSGFDEKVQAEAEDNDKLSLYDLDAIVNP